MRSGARVIRIQFWLSCQNRDHDVDGCEMMMMMMMVELDLVALDWIASELGSGELATPPRARPHINLRAAGGVAQSGPN